MKRLPALFLAVMLLLLSCSCAEDNLGETASVSQVPGFTAVITDVPTSEPEPTAAPAPAFVREGNCIYFGLYPQSEITDADLKETLAGLSGDVSEWTSFNYYLDSKMSDFMFYKDVIYNGTMFRGVYFTKYRPSSVAVPDAAAEDSVIGKNGYSTDTVYWFRYDPVKWIILEEKNGDAFLLSDIALDAQPFQITRKKINGNYPNNYELSYIRMWLNSTFYDTAFSDEEKECIAVTKVNNELLTTGYESCKYLCNDTEDCVFLLSREESEARYYNFRKQSGIKVCHSDYSHVQGIDKRYTYTDQWLRSPSDLQMNCVQVINDGGVYSAEWDVMTQYVGVVPAIHLITDEEAYRAHEVTASPEPIISDCTPVPDKERLYRRTTDVNTNNDVIYFGSYPQSQVRESGLIETLNGLAGSTDTWFSYDYYTDGDREDTMKYIDITYGDNRYRGVYIGDYRTLYTGSPKMNGQTVQERAGYKIGEKYWFKFEPIEWDVISESDGDVLLLASQAIDSQDFQHFSGMKRGVLGSNYKDSYIRAWLNSTFYDTAFTDDEKTLIKITAVDNSAHSTGMSRNPSACDDTQDRLFLISYDEAVHLPDNIFRNKFGTAYAGSQGLYVFYYSSWSFRSPDDLSGIYSFDGHGSIATGRVNDTSCGVVPMLHLSI